jgi:hypothetical protein
MDPEKKPSLFADIRLIFATILTDPGSSLAYGADALIAVTIVLFPVSYGLGITATLIGAGTIMLVYLTALLVYDLMVRHHTHKIFGGGAYVSAYLTSLKIRHHPRLKRMMANIGKLGTASLLADFPATQAISVIAGVEALSLIPVEQRLQFAFAFVLFLSVIQKWGLGSLSRFMIWPIILFYATNLGINLFGLVEILREGFEAPIITGEIRELNIERTLIPVLAMGIANGATIITGVEVGYSAINIPYHKGRAIRISMAILFAIVSVTYILQIINFIGLGITYNSHIPVPLQIALHVGGEKVALAFGFLTAMILLLAAQTAQSDFPLELLRASRSRFFPRGLGDMAWKKTSTLFNIGGHEGVYNPRAVVLLAILSLGIIFFFPDSHQIEGMYGLAVMLAMNITIFSFLVRQVRARRFSPLTWMAFAVMQMMLWNILYNKFFEGAWFILFLMLVYYLTFKFSESLYQKWEEKLRLVPLELGLWYPAFADLPVDDRHIVLVSKFHPGVIHFLKQYTKSGRIPLVVHFHTDAEEPVPKDLPQWFKILPVPPEQDTITAITQYIRTKRPERVHLIPLLVEGPRWLTNLFFGNSIQRLIFALSRQADLQVEYNRERISFTAKELLTSMNPFT